MSSTDWPVSIQRSHKDLWAFSHVDRIEVAKDFRFFSMQPLLRLAELAAFSSCDSQGFYFRHSFEANFFKPPSLPRKDHRGLIVSPSNLGKLA